MLLEIKLFNGKIVRFHEDSENKKKAGTERSSCTRVLKLKSEPVFNRYCVNSDVAGTRNSDNYIFEEIAAKTIFLLKNIIMQV